MKSLRFSVGSRLGYIWAGLALVAALRLGAETQTFDLTSASIVEVNAAMSAGALTSEKLTRLFLDRINAYEKGGPKLHAIITLNPKALDEARALDDERRVQGPRGPLHGMPVLLKDNIETHDMPTTAGSYALRNSIPAQDSEQARRLRAAGCIILGKTNMSEFASGAAVSTLGGQMLNPHALDHTPRGSSGGSGISVAAGFAMFALGTDTGGSIRRPSTATGIVGLKPTYGLNGRGGIIPLALSLDTVGPMARHVADVAVVLNVMAGPDARDPATRDAATRRSPDYTAGLKADALKGARFGLLRDWMGVDAGVDAVVETAVAVLRNQGAEVVKVAVPRYVIGVAGGLYSAIHDVEFHHQIEDYLGALPRRGKDTPGTVADLVRLTEKITAPTPDGWVPNPDRLRSLKRQIQPGTLHDTPYLDALNEGRKIVRDNLSWIMSRDNLDAFIVPTSSSPPDLIVPRVAGPATTKPAPLLTGSVDQLSNITGWPDLVVPAGFTSDPALPVGLSFIGPAFSEARLLGYGYAFERALPVRRLPLYTPALPGERFQYETHAAPGGAPGR